MNSVLLGYADEPILEKGKNSVNYTTNKIGGIPDWPTASFVHDFKCELCDSILTLVVQIYAPLEEHPSYHRTLYIFACLQPTCQNNSASWKCIRTQCKAEEITAQLGHGSENDNDWCDGSDDWGDADISQYTNTDFPFDECKYGEHSANANQCGDAIASNELTSVNHVLSVSERKLLEGIHWFVPMYISVSEEVRAQKNGNDRADELLNMYSQQERTQFSSNISGSVTDAKFDSTFTEEEQYEKSFPLHGQKLFLTLISRLRENPGHIIRYCRNNAAPLFLHPEPNIPEKCDHCDGDVVFEMQILPTLISFLTANGDSSNDKESLEFGSVFVYTCKQSCWAPGDVYKQEHVIVQKEDGYSAEA